MAYSSWSVIYGEQPSASKWNILGTNDASFNDGTGIANLATNVTSISNPYKFHAKRTAAANTGNNTFATVVYDTEAYDTNNNFSTSTGTYTVPVNGFYHFSWSGSAATSAGGQTVLFSLFVSGTETARGSRALSNAVGILGSSGSATVQLSATNAVTVRAYGNAAFALDVGTANYNYFTGFLVSQT